MAKRKTQPDLARYVTSEDVEVVVQRIPKEHRKRLREVFISARSRGVRWLGAVTRRGRRDIDLYSTLPYRVSLGRYITRGQSAVEFGAPARGQWPPWAIRRFLLYDVLLHEIGHLQVVDSKNKNVNRKYASETLAQEFANNWRIKLWASHFDHPDPVHNQPTEAELSIIALWKNLNKDQRFRFVDIALRAPHDEMPDMSEFGEIDDQQKRFLVPALMHNSRNP